MFIWADGIDSGLRSDDVKRCALVVIGFNGHGQKRLLTLEDGGRELERVAIGVEHMRIIRIINPIESTFSMIIRHRTKRTKGCLNRNGMLCMMFKLGKDCVDCAE